MSLAMLPVPAPAFYEYRRSSGKVRRESYTVIGIETDDGDGTFLERTRLICLNHAGHLTWLGATQLIFDVDYLPPAPDHGSEATPEPFQGFDERFIHEKPCKFAVNRDHGVAVGVTGCSCI